MLGLHQMSRLLLYGVGGHTQQSAAALLHGVKKAAGVGQLFLQVLPVLRGDLRHKGGVWGVQRRDMGLVDQRDGQRAVLEVYRHVRYNEYGGLMIKGAAGAGLQRQQQRHGGVCRRHADARQRQRAPRQRLQMLPGDQCRQGVGIAHSLQLQA